MCFMYVNNYNPLSLNILYFIWYDFNYLKNVNKSFNEKVLYKFRLNFVAIKM